MKVVTLLGPYSSKQTEKLVSRSVSDIFSDLEMGRNRFEEPVLVNSKFTVCTSGLKVLEMPSSAVHLPQMRTNLF